MFFFSVGKTLYYIFAFLCSVHVIQLIIDFPFFTTFHLNVWVDKSNHCMFFLIMHSYWLSHAEIHIHILLARSLDVYLCVYLYRNIFFFRQPMSVIHSTNLAENIMIMHCGARCVYNKRNIDVRQKKVSKPRTKLNSHRMTWFVNNREQHCEI